MRYNSTQTAASSSTRSIDFIAHQMATDIHNACALVYSDFAVCPETAVFETVRPRTAANDGQDVCRLRSLSPPASFSQRNYADSSYTRPLLPPQTCQSVPITGPVSVHLPAYGYQTGNVAWAERPRYPEECSFSPDPTNDKGKPRQKIIDALTIHTCEACPRVPNNNSIPQSASVTT